MIGIKICYACWNSVEECNDLKSYAYLAFANFIYWGTFPFAVTQLYPPSPHTSRWSLGPIWLQEASDVKPYMYKMIAAINDVVVTDMIEWH